MGKLSWTHFYLGCLENKIDVCRYDAKPKFRVVAAVDRLRISKYDLRSLNQRGHFEQVPFSRHHAELEVKLDVSFSCRPMHLFKKLWLSKWSLRFPRICKVHDDRTYKDSISFDELQQIAKQNSTLLKDGNIRREKE
jgi:DNA ligase-4